VMEEFFWPLKISDASIPTYLISIKPYWAMQLFDEDIANQYLLGADVSRFFSMENVYYSNKVNFHPQCGARILWYVTQSKNKNESHIGGYIKACSRLIDSRVDTAKALYDEFQRLGIYDWNLLMKQTGNNPFLKIRSYRFYQTELFRNPIVLDQLQKYGIKQAPQSPISLTQAQFLSIYRSGKGIK